MLEVNITKKLNQFTLHSEFTVQDNETLALLGSSGSGKSMTLRCIAGIVEPDNGYIRLNGRTLYDSDKMINLPPQDRKVGYLFQDYALFPNMKVRENILTAIKLRSEYVEQSLSFRLGEMGRNYVNNECDSLLDRFKIKEIENQYTDMISGGQKQRTALARMLAAQPDLILLDEPFSSLDSNLKWTLEQEVMRLLESVVKPRILVTHNRDEVYLLADKVSCISDGLTQEVQDKEDFFASPKTVEAAILSGCKNISYYNEEKSELTDWGINISESPVIGRIDRQNIKAVGIRAHSLIPDYMKDKEQSLDSYWKIPVYSYECGEEMFEWVMSFRPSKEATSKMQWRVSKQVYRDKPQAPEYFLVDMEKGLLLF